MADDKYLSIYEVTYYSRGEVRTALVPAHNDLRDPRDDEYDREHGEHYRLWRFMPDGRRITAFRCRYEEWISTAALANPPPKAEELQELDQLREESADLRERVAMADARMVVSDERAATAQAEVHELRRRADTAEQKNARLQAELEEAQRQLNRMAAPPEVDDVPF